MTDSAGNQQALYDYAPYGEELTTQGSRDARWGDSGVGLRFTGKQQEGSEGDYMYDFGARYYSAGMGRFTSPDEPLFDQRASNPQSWNLYMYGRNNPLSYVDPTGNCSVKAGDSAATDDPGPPCVAPGGTSVTVTAQGGDPDEARIAQFVILLGGDLQIQLKEARNIAVSTYVSSIVGWGFMKFILGPAAEAILAKYAAQQALKVASEASTGARAGRVWTAAYDVDTGAVAVGHSGPIPNAADLHPNLVGKLDQIGGVGAKNPGANGPVGCCGEVDAVNQLLQRGSKAKNIRVLDYAVRPRTGEVIPRCTNCQAVFGK